MSTRSGFGNIGRRPFLAGLIGVSCARPVTVAELAHEPRASVALWSWFDLPVEDARGRELSGIAWDEARRTAWAVGDEVPRIVGLVPDEDLRSWTFGPSVDVDITNPVTGAREVLDLEGIVVAPDGFVVCSENGPRVFEVDRGGRLRKEIAVPPRFLDGRRNKSVESLTRSPSGRYLFVTSEVALHGDGDGATARLGTRVRIVRVDALGTPTTEHLHITDPAPDEGWDWGVADLAALGDDDLLVLERGWKADVGNAARIYRVKLDERSLCTGTAGLAATRSLAKWLWVDVGDLRATLAPPVHQPQPNPLLDNYEGMSLGPRLPDGRSSLILVSDDNGHAEQIARILVLAFRSARGSSARLSGARRRSSPSRPGTPPARSSRRTRVGWRSPSRPRSDGFLRIWVRSSSKRTARPRPRPSNDAVDELFDEP